MNEIFFLPLATIAIFTILVSLIYENEWGIVVGILSVITLAIWGIMADTKRIEIYEEVRTKAGEKIIVKTKPECMILGIKFEKRTKTEVYEWTLQSLPIKD